MSGITCAAKRSRLSSTNEARLAAGRFYSRREGSGGDAGPQVRGIDRVGEQHRDGHGTQAAGHRGDPAGTLGGTLELDIADEFAGSAAVDPHVEYRGPGTDPVPGNEAGFADRGHHQLGALNLGPEVPRSRMAHGHG